jgi:hypothetical protein
MRAKLRPAQGRAIGRKRAGLAEPVFGTLKEQRQGRKFRLRGMKCGCGVLPDGACLQSHPHASPESAYSRLTQQPQGSSKPFTNASPTPLRRFDSPGPPALSTTLQLRFSSNRLAPFFNQHRDWFSHRLGSRVLHSRRKNCPIDLVACLVRCSFSINAKRTNPSPRGPNPTPGETATNAFSIKSFENSSDPNS